MLWNHGAYKKCTSDYAVYQRGKKLWTKNTWKNWFRVQGRDSVLAEIPAGSTAVPSTHLGLPDEPVGVGMVQLLHDSLDSSSYFLWIRITTVHHLQHINTRAFSSKECFYVITKCVGWWWGHSQGHQGLATSVPTTPPALIKELHGTSARVVSLCLHASCTPSNSIQTARNVWMCYLGTQLVGMVEMAWQLNLMISELFSNLTDSTVLRFWPHGHRAVTGVTHRHGERVGWEEDDDIFPLVRWKEVQFLLYVIGKALVRKQKGKGLDQELLKGNTCSQMRQQLPHARLPSKCANS